MACPHVSGAAALLKSAHPDWTPAAIRSAMMTTANIVDNRLQTMTDESTGKPATSYGFGSGHLNLDHAMDPGLVYDISPTDYVNFLCSIGYLPNTIQVITRIPATCPMKKPLPENLNYPSIMTLFLSTSSGVLSKSFIRMVTNVGPVNYVYRVKIEAPQKCVSVLVKPVKLVFSEMVKKHSFVVTVMANTPVFNLFGSTMELLRDAR
uniref:Uncharacterized protein n=1 Tax=Nelumbo nucifera TaxID=4432 RepID=A0A822XJV2_NELNU|nr:TPA_asm: hypothetical protein HUJ06_022123 [Nelumbo nucifera]